MEQIEIYQNEEGKTQLVLKIERDSLWLSQVQLADLFDKDVRTVNEHIKNIYNTAELDKESTIRKFRIVRQEGKRQVTREIDHYNLDMAISVGYRVNSVEGTQFRKWATARLNEYLLKGYTLNQQRFARNSQELEQALALINKAVQSPDISADTGKGLAEIVTRYTQTFLWLQRYDEGLLDEPQGQAGGILVDTATAMRLNGIKATTDCPQRSDGLICSAQRQCKSARDDCRSA